MGLTLKDLPKRTHGTINCLSMAKDHKPLECNVVISWLMKQPGWIDGSGEYRSQAWLPLPDGRVLRVCSGEEEDEPDLLVDIYDPRGTPWDTRYYKPR